MYVLFLYNHIQIYTDKYSMYVNCPGAPFGFYMPSRLRLETGVAWRFIGLVLARADRRSTRGCIAPW